MSLPTAERMAADMFNQGKWLNGELDHWEPSEYMDMGWTN